MSKSLKKHWETPQLILIATDNVNIKQTNFVLEHTGHYSPIGSFVNLPGGHGIPAKTIAFS